jgi:hypothetical protein
MRTEARLQSDNSRMSAIQQISAHNLPRPGISIWCHLVPFGAKFQKLAPILPIFAAANRPDLTECFHAL